MTRLPAVWLDQGARHHTRSADRTCDTYYRYAYFSIYASQRSPHCCRLSGKKYTLRPCWTCPTNAGAFGPVKEDFGGGGASYPPLRLETGVARGDSAGDGPW